MKPRALVYEHRAARPPRRYAPTQTSLAAALVALAPGKRLVLFLATEWWAPGLRPKVRRSDAVLLVLRQSWWQRILTDWQHREYQAGGRNG